MLFNSYAFLFLFLPAILTGTIAIERGLGRRAVLYFLTLASLFFYWRLAGQGALALLNIVHPRQSLLRTRDCGQAAQGRAGR